MGRLDNISGESIWLNFNDLYTIENHIQSVIMQKHLLLALCMASAAASTTLSAADFTPPCEIPCGTQAELTANWSIVDNNNDGAGDETTWAYSSSDNAVVYSYHRTNAADDWLISKVPVELKAGETYKVTGNIKTYNNNTEESIAFYTATADNIEALSQNKFYFDEKLASNSYDWRGGSFTPSADGKYYFAIQCYSIKNRWKVYFRGLQIEIVRPHPLAATDVTAKAAPEGELKATVSWTMPTKLDNDAELTSISGAKIYRGTSSYFSLNSSTLIGTYTGGTPGAVSSWDDTTLEKAGKYYYAVVPFDENGDSPATPTRVQSDWIGMDERVGTVLSPNAALEDDSDTKISLSWEAPKGANGGCIDLTKIKYRITRVGKIKTTSVTIAEDITETTFSDAVNPFDVYTYTVYASYNGGSYGTSGANSNEVTVNGILEAPYTENFSSSATLNFWTLLHSDETTKDWSVTSSKLGLYGGPADAWAATPPIRLKAGVPYEFSFTPSLSYYTPTKDVSLYLGKEPTVAGLQTELHKVTASSTYGSAEKISFSVTEDGIYYLAFRCVNAGSDYRTVYVDDLNLTEIECSPLAVTDLTATAAEKGAMDVTLSWINPAKTNAGTDLSEITKIEVLRGNDVIATLTEGLTPGESSAYVDNTIESPGKYIYKVIPYLGANAGPSASVESGWVGPDTPAAPSSVTATLTDEGRVITFEANLLGLNGGYVDADALTFTITRNGSDVATGLTTSPFTDSDDLEFGNYVYGVKAVNGSEESDITEAAPLKFGNPLELPYKVDSFNEDNASLWTLTGDNPNKTWVLKDGALTGNFIADNSWAFTPPLKLVHSELKVKMNGSSYNGRNPETMEIYISKSTDHTNSEHHRLVHTATFDSSWGQDAEQSFIVTHPGIYHIGIRLPENNWTAKINSASLEATTILTGVEDVAADGDGKLMYSRTFDFIQAPEGVEVNVYNAAGVLVLRAEAIDGHVDTSALASGLYVAAATASGENLTLKFAK